MKLSSVLSKYLAEKKVLNLPGVGTFSSDGSYPSGTSTIPSGTKLEQKNITAFDDDLVDYVSKETGKMKTLAASDLESQVEDMLQFLNTGKPYLIQGIGTLLKKQTGQIEFYSEKYNPTEIKEKPSFKNEKNEIPQSYIENTNRRKNLRPMLVILGLTILAIVATTWFYLKSEKSNTNVVKEAEVEKPDIIENKNADTAKIVTNNNQLATTSPNTYTYVLETAKEPRASKRFNQLKTIKWPVELEKVDSLNYRIVMKLPSTNADTTHVKDSLRILNGRQVYILH